MSDALTTLRTALAPTKGMKRIPFPLESYQHPSKPLSAKRLMNVMAEAEPADARSPAVLISTPGLTYLGEGAGGGPVYAQNSDMPGVIYFVSGTHFFRWQSGGTFTDLGDIGTPVSPDFPFETMYTIAVGSPGAVVVSPPNAYTCTHSGALNQLGGTFPASGASSVAYVDGYYVFTAAGATAQWFICALLDPTTFDALDFATVEGVPNVIRRVMTLRGELWFGGDAALEVWYDSGDLDFPFRRRSGGVIPYGIESPRSMAIIDNSLWWVGVGGMVFRSSGYQGMRVSTHAIEDIIQSLGVANLVSAVAFNFLGHVCYCLNYTTRSLVYDATTKAWHDRASSADGSGPWRAASVSQIGEQVIFGDQLSGRMLRPDLNSGLEDGVAVPRQFTMPPIWAGTNRAFASRLEIEMEVGTALSSGNVTLEWSDDGGTNWNGSRTLTPSGAIALRQRVVATRMGSFRQRVYRVTGTGRPTYYAVDGDITGPPTTSGG